jgi:hypothetical protein
MNFLDENTCFGKIKYMNFIPYETIKEFIDNYIYCNSNTRKLLMNLNDIYFLVAIYDSNKVINSWENKLSCYQYSYLKKNKYYILGFILVSEVNDKHIDYIECIDTRLRKHNLAIYMIKKYEAKYMTNGIILPKDIIVSSVGFWEKYFKRLNINNVIELNNFIDKLNINNYNINWYELKKQFLLSIIFSRL